MSDNSLTLFGDKPIAMKNSKAMAAALKGTSEEQAISQLPDGGVYISFSGKKNAYSIGEEKADADPEEVWLVNIYSFEKGWVCWKGGSPASKRMASIYGEPVATPDFDEHGPFNANSGDGWYNASAFMLRSIDRGIQGYFSTNTKSALNEFGKLQGEVARRLEEGEPAWPIVQLGREEFRAQGQTNGKPKFEVYGWLGDAQIQAMSEFDDIADISEALDDLIAEAEEDARSNVDHDTGVEEVEDFDTEPVDEEPEPEPKPSRRRAAAATTTTAPGGSRRRRANV